MPEFYLQGLERFTAALTEQVAKAAVGARLAVTDMGHLLEREVKVALTAYPHAKGTSTPSPPGAAPGLVTGTLRRSIRTEIVGLGLGTFQATVGPTVIYGRIQELGGRAGHSVLPARPYLAPSHEALVHSGAYSRAATAAFARAIG